MNLPNKLTVLRVVLIPFCVYFLIGSSSLYAPLISLVIFAVASFTDYLDGYLARKHNLVTDFGKLMDPLADKLLVTSLLIGLIEYGMIQSYIVMLIIGREFAVTSLRLIAAGKGSVLAADKLGKIKTVLQMLFVIYSLGLLSAISITQNFALMSIEPLTTIHQILMWSMAALTILSGLNYFIKNKDVFMADC